MGESSSLPFAVWIHTSVESSAGRSPRLMPIAAARPPTHEMSGAWLTVTRWIIRGRLPSYGASGLTSESHPTSSIPARMTAAAALNADLPLLRIRLCSLSRSPWLWRAGRQPRYASAAAGEEGTKALSGAWVPTRRVRILFAERIDRGKNQRSRDHLCKRLRSHKSVTCGTSMRLRRHGNSHGLRRGDGFSHDQPGLQYDSFSFPAMSLQLLREQLHGDLAHHLLGLP